MKQGFPLLSAYGLYVVPIADIAPQTLAEIREKLSKNEKYSQKFQGKIINVYWVNAGMLFMPRNFGAKYFGKAKSISLTTGIAIQGLVRNETIKLWPHQIDAVNAVVADYKEGNYGSIVKIPCGKGKTFTMLELIRHIGRKTLIIVDKSTLADDWLRECILFYGKTARVVIKGEAKDCDINIMVINSVYLGKRKPDAYLDYGLVIIDEVHNIVGQRVLDSFRYISRRYIVGISGTPTRPDHLEYMIEWFVGPIIYESLLDYAGEKPIIHSYVYNSSDEKFAKSVVKKNINGRESIDATATLKNTMIYDLERREFLAKLIVKYAAMFPQILVIGLFRDQLEGLMLRLSELGVKYDEIGIYYGGLSRSENDIIRAKHIILGMRKMCAESLNIPDLRCEILGSSYKPANNGANVEKFEQQLHRIMRKDHKVAPVIVDIFDNYGFFRNHWRLRSEYYAKLGWKVTRF